MRQSSSNGGPPALGSGALVGVLASQGGFGAHVAALRALGADAREVRTAAELTDLDALVIPGGESTTLVKAIERDGLEGPIREHAAAGKPILGTCAGMILLGREHLGLLDVAVARNAFGRQLQSFEKDLDVPALGSAPLRAVFIRAPRVEDAGEKVEVLATVGDHPVAVREGSIIACAFHPELTDDDRIHRLLLDSISSVMSR